MFMIVSRDATWLPRGEARSVAAFSDHQLAGSAGTSMRRLGLGTKNKPEHLGIHFGPGGRTRQLFGTSSRWAALRNRCLRTKRLGRTSGIHIFRTGIQRAALYGALLAAPSLNVVREMRRTAARSIWALLRAVTHGATRCCENRPCLRSCKASHIGMGSSDMGALVLA